MKFLVKTTTVLLASGMVLASVAPAFGQMAVHEIVQNVKIVRSSPALDAVIAPDVKVEKIATGFIWTEGPMWRKRALWFSDLSGNKMYSLTADGNLKVQLDKAGGLQSFPAGGYGGSNAMVADKDGSVLMMQHGMRRIVRLDDKMNVKVVVDKYQGQPFNSPNDLVFTADGTMYFTDPPYGLYDPAAPKQRSRQRPSPRYEVQRVYRYKDGNLTAVITDLPRPNGLAFSQDGKHSTSRTRKTRGLSISMTSILMARWSTGRLSQT